MPLFARCAVSLTLGILFVLPAAGQITPDRTYYGRHRPIPVTVRIPPETKGDARIALLEPVTAKVAAAATVAPGTVNLAAVFPSLWQDFKVDDKTQPPKLLYAQLIVADKKIGAPVVLQPMIDPAYCPLIEDTGEPKFRASKGTYSGLRAYPERYVIMETTVGDIQFIMRPDEAPNTVFNFLSLCQGGFYTDVIFHRIKPRHPNGAPFVIQAGDPLQLKDSTDSKGGEGGPGFAINLEPSKLPHDFGILSMARSNLPNSAGSQFFICLSRKGTEYLDGKYTSFAQTVSGDDVIQKIAASELVAGAERPKDPPVIKRCRLIDAAPYGEGPKPIVLPEEKPQGR